MPKTKLSLSKDQGAFDKSPIFSMPGKLLGLFLFLALVPLLVHFYLSVDTGRKALIEEAGAGIAVQAEAAMAQLQSNLVHSQKNVLNWSNLPAITEVLGDAGEEHILSINELFQQYVRIYGIYESITLVNEQGKIIAASTNDLLGKSVASSDWFVETQSFRQSRVGPFKLDANIDNYGVPISVPVLFRQNNATKVGVLNAYYSWREFQSAVNKIKVRASSQDKFGFALLVDGDGFVLAAPDVLLYASKDSNDAAALDMNQVTGQINQYQPSFGLGKGYKLVTLQDRSTILAYSTILNGAQKERGMVTSQNWRLLIFKDAVTAVSAETALLRKMFVLVAVTILVVVLLALIVSRRFSGPILALISRLKELNSGNLDVSLKLEGSDEYAMLGNAFDELRSELKQHISQLSSVNTRYSDLVNTIAGVVWEGGGKPFHFTFLSQQVYDICGYKAGWLLANQSFWLEMIHPEDGERLLKTLARLRIGESAVVEYRVSHKDGRVVWLKNFMATVEKEGGDYSLRGVAFDITDVKAAEADIQAARNMALSTAQSRSDFLATMSHELRTPVNGMMGMLELMDEGKIDPREAQYFSLALTSGRQLINLLDDILDYTKVENGGLLYEKVPFDLREFMESVVSLLASAALSKNLDLGLVLARDIPQVIKSDPSRLRQVLVNLVSNAVKFTERGSVCVWAEVRSDDMLWIEVRDTGIGVSPTQHEVLFEPFVLADASSTRSNRGCGLGLYLTKRIVEGLGGSIVASSVQDAGSSFCFEVPIEVVTPAKPVPSFFESKENAVVIGAKEATFLSLEALLDRQNIFTIVEGCEVKRDQFHGGLACGKESVGGAVSADAFLALWRKHQARYFFVDGSALTVGIINAWLAIADDERPKLFCLGTSLLHSDVHQQITADIQNLSRLSL